MTDVLLEDQLRRTAADLEEALRWFHGHAGQEISWPSPSPLPSMPHVVTKAKGIYKPQQSDFALTVRQTLDGPYADREPIVRDDGSWLYVYHQEGADPGLRDDDYTNRALMRNLSDGVPVAVLVQTRPKPNVRYKVLGLALVTRWSEGFFYLEGFGPSDRAHGVGVESEDTYLESEAQQSIDDALAEPLDPGHDARVRAMASIVRRMGQGAFRRDLLAAYGARCAFTGCDVEAVLDAAHIIPYRGVGLPRLGGQVGCVDYAALRAELWWMFSYSAGGR